MLKDYLENPEMIAINYNNLNNIHIDNIVCFSFASPGAMGDGGALIIGYKDNKSFSLYYFNVGYNDNFKLVDDILDNLFFKLIGSELNSKTYQSLDLVFIRDVVCFKCIPMGFGNDFYIRNEYFKEFEKMCLNFHKDIFDRRGRLYKWQLVVMNLFFNPELEMQKNNFLHGRSNAVLGAIIGDIIGSRFKFHPHRSKKFELFYSKTKNKIPKTLMEYEEGCRFTDDTVMTLAIAKTMLEANGNYDNLDKLAIRNMKQLGKNIHLLVMVECLIDGYKYQNLNHIILLEMEVQ